MTVLEISISTLAMQEKFFWMIKINLFAIGRNSVDTKHAMSLMGMMRLSAKKTAKTMKRVSYPRTARQREDCSNVA